MTVKATKEGMRMYYIIKRDHRHHRIPHLKVFAGLRVRHDVSSCLSGTRLCPFLAATVWLKGLPVVLGLPMKISSFPKPLQSSTVKLIGRRSLSVSPVVRTKLVERYVFAIISSLLLQQISLNQRSSDGFTRCLHRSRNRHGPKKRMRS